MKLNINIGLNFYIRHADVIDVPYLIYDALSDHAHRSTSIPSVFVTDNLDIATEVNRRCVPSTDYDIIILLLDKAIERESVPEGVTQTPKGRLTDTLRNLLRAYE